MSPCSGRATRTEWIKSAVAWKVWKRRIFSSGSKMSKPTLNHVKSSVKSMFGNIWDLYGLLYFKCIETQDLQYISGLGLNMDPEWGFHMENHGGYVKETTGRLFFVSSCCFEFTRCWSQGAGRLIPRPCSTPTCGYVYQVSWRLWGVERFTQQQTKIMAKQPTSDTWMGI
jgi:hypothetical protein